MITVYNVNVIATFSIQAVSMLMYDDAAAGMLLNPSPGYPLVCITVSYQSLLSQKITNCHFKKILGPYTIKKNSWFCKTLRYKADMPLIKIVILTYILKQYEHNNTS